MAVSELVTPAFPGLNPVSDRLPDGGAGVGVGEGPPGPGVGVGVGDGLPEARATANSAFTLPSPKNVEEPIFSAVSFNICST